MTFWIEFGILFTASLLGALAILPYSLRLLEGSVQKNPLKMSMQKIVVLSVVQNVILFAVVTGVGLWAAHAIGLGAPYIEAALAGNLSSQSLMYAVVVAIVWGAIAGATLLIADLFFLPYWPQPLVDTARKTTAWENFSASFYGGINEELLIRLFGLSVLLWLLSLVLHTPSGAPTIAGFWIVNVVMTIVFGLGHLPAIKNLAGTISPVMFARTLLLNAPIGLLCGWLFWIYGIEAAIVAHFCADIIYHVYGTFVLRQKIGV